MIVLMFASYKAQLADSSWIQGFHTCVLTMAEPSDFSKQMNELLAFIQVNHNSNNVIVENVSMQEWKE